MLPVLNPVAFTVLGLEIKWYGVIIAAAMFFAVVIVYKRAKVHRIIPDRILDFVLICVPLGVIGARVYYILFNWEMFAGDWLKMINTRTGGLAIHGGLIFGFLAAVILCRRWEVRPLDLLDLTVPAVALAQAIGRWGNYFNQEAHGGPTDLPWAIAVNGQMVHPTFLYESIWCLFLFFVLIFIDNRRKFEGQVFFLYGIGYSFERFFVEGLRTDSLMLGPFRQAQLLSIAIFVIFLIAYILVQKKNSHKNRIFY